MPRSQLFWMGRPVAAEAGDLLSNVDGVPVPRMCQPLSFRGAPQERTRNPRLDGAFYARICRSHPVVASGFFAARSPGMTRGVDSLEGLAGRQRKRNQADRLARRRRDRAAQDRVAGDGVVLQLRLADPHLAPDAASLRFHPGNADLLVDLPALGLAELRGCPEIAEVAPAIGPARTAGEGRDLSLIHI